MTPLPTYSPLPARARPVLRWIGDGGLASRGQLARRFWPQARPHAAYVYLRRLVRAGYLATAPQTVLGAARDLSVLPPAASAALGVRPPWVRLGWPPPQEWAHLFLGQELRLRWEAELAQAGQGGRLLAWRPD